MRNELRPKTFCNICSIFACLLLLLFSLLLPFLLPVVRFAQNSCMELKSIDYTTQIFFCPSKHSFQSNSVSKSVQSWSWSGHYSTVTVSKSNVTSVHKYLPTYFCFVVEGRKEVGEIIGKSLWEMRIGIEFSEKRIVLLKQYKMAEILLDPKIRLWVFLPIVIITFLVGIVRHYFSIVLASQKKVELIQMQDRYVFNSFSLFTTRNLWFCCVWFFLFIYFAMHFQSSNDPRKTVA